MENIVLFVNKNNTAYSKNDKYIIASKYKDNQWHIIESHNYGVPQKERDILAKHDFKNGHIKTENDCRIFMQELNEIIIK